MVPPTVKVVVTQVTCAVVTLALPTVPVFADLVYGVVSDRRQDLGWAVGIRHEVACPVHGGETKGD